MTDIKLNAVSIFCVLIAINTHLADKMDPYGRVIHVCDNVTSFSTSEPLTVVNYDFPRVSRTVDAQCACTMTTSSRNIEFLPIYQRWAPESGVVDFPLVILVNKQSYKYRTDNVIMTDFGLGVERLDFILQSNRNNSPSASFAFAFVVRQKNQSEIIDVTCMTSLQPKENKTDNNSNKNSESDSNLINEINNISSPEFVIILIALCCALLLIVLIVSVMLCCVMPRKQKYEIKKIRASMMLLDADMPRVDVIRPESHIYDNTNRDQDNGYQHKADTLPVHLAVPNHYGNIQQDSKIYQNT